jgi:hypothetical protein
MKLSPLQVLQEARDDLVVEAVGFHTDGRTPAHEAAEPASLVLGQRLPNGVPGRAERGQGASLGDDAIAAQEVQHVAADIGEPLRRQAGAGRGQSCDTASVDAGHRGHCLRILTEQPCHGPQSRRQRGAAGRGQLLIVTDALNNHGDAGHLRAQERVVRGSGRLRFCGIGKVWGRVVQCHLWSFHDRGGQVGQFREDIPQEIRTITSTIFSLYGRKPWSGLAKCGHAGH